MIAAHTPLVGQQAPDLNIDTPDGTNLSLSDLKANRTLVIFARHLG